MPPGCHTVIVRFIQSQYKQKRENRMATKEKMSSGKNTPRLLGAAFLLQAVASLVGYSLLDPLIVSGDIIASMTKISNNALQMRASIVGEMITAIGIVMLGSLLFVTLKKVNMEIALVALGLRLVEAALLAASRIPAFSLLRTSQESVIAGHPTYLQTLGGLFYESQEFAYSLNMLLFSLGATLFYYLFFKSGYIPRALALFGLIAAPVAVIGTLGELFGIDVPMVIFAPNFPFEIAIGLWLMVKGIKDSPVTK